MARGWVGRLVATLLIGAAAVLGVASPAAAHSETVRSDPPNGGMVPEGRTSLTLWFDEPVASAISTFELRTLEGLDVQSQVRYEEPQGSAKVVLETEPLARGQYLLDWHALSLVDGHASSGTIVFGAGLRPDVVAADGTGPPSIGLLVLRWLDLACLLLALGALAVGGSVLGAAGPVAARGQARIRWLGAVAVSAAVYAGAVTPFLRTRASGSAGPAWLDQTWLVLSATGWGRLWLLREVALVVAAVAMLGWRRRPSSVPTVRVAAGALALAVLCEAAGGHAAALPSGTVVDAVMAAGHVLASGVWVGGLALLALTLVPLLRRTDEWSGARLPVWHAFSRRAAIATAVLVATGVYQAGHHLLDLDSLTSSVYGRTVALKVALVAAALTLAGLNTLLIRSELAERLAARLRTRPVSGPPRLLARTVAAELVVLVAAVLAAGVLSSAPTAREIAVATAPSTPQAANVDGLFLTFEAVPDGPGQHRLILRMRSTIQPPPARVTGVDVAVVDPARQPQTVRLEPVEDGRFEGALATSRPGDWQGTVLVHRAGLVDSTMLSGWTVQPPAAQVTGSLGAASTTLAAALLAGLALTLVRLRRRRTPPGQPAPLHPHLEESSR